MARVFSNSVVMTTYNGEQFLKEQLESLMEQTLLPDEIVVADDCSTDGSLALVCDFAAAHSEVEWVVYNNDHNLGWKRNFKNAIFKARGEYSYLCDQDDIWMPNHIAILRSAMDAHPEVDVLTSHAEPVYEEGAFSSAALKRVSGESGEVVAIPADKRYLLISAPGCTYCVRRTFEKSLEPFWPDDFPHDSILYSSACLKRTLAHLDATTLVFRRHADNASDLRAKDRESSLELMHYFLNKNGVLRQWLSSLSEEEQARLSAYGVMTLLDDMDEFTRLRVAVLERPTPASLSRLLTHAGMYPTRRNMLGDLACAFFPNRSWAR